MERTFNELVAEAAAAPVDGWDFSWLHGRATEERPSWGYQRVLSGRLAGASAAVDLETGGGEILGGVARFPPVMLATEAWPPNVTAAARLLAPRGVWVVAASNEALPFAAASFDLVVSRHPAAVRWGEIARVVRPAGTYFAQHVGPATMWELVEHFLGPQPQARHSRHPDREAADARAAGLEVVDVRSERLRAEFFDVGAVIYFLRKVIWTVPGFIVDDYPDRLRAMHHQIQRDGRFVAHATRTLIEVMKPG